MRIEELEALAEAQLAQEAAEEGGYITSRDSRGNVTFYAQPTLSERIYRAVEAHDRAVSRADIAKCVGLKKTPHLYAAIEDLVARGLLCRLHGSHTNGALKYLYEVAR